MLMSHNNDASEVLTLAPDMTLEPWKLVGTVLEVALYCVVAAFCYEHHQLTKMRV